MAKGDKGKVNSDIIKMKDGSVVRVAVIGVGISAEEILRRLSMRENVVSCKYLGLQYQPIMPNEAFTSEEFKKNADEFFKYDRFDRNK